jgi:amino acid permease
VQVHLHIGQQLNINFYLVGLLAMPAAMASVGWVVGSIFIFSSASLAYFGLNLFSKCAERVGGGSREVSISSIAKATYPRSAKLVDFALALKCFGVAISYLIVIGDMMPSIVAGFGVESKLLLSRRLWICLLSFVLMGPLAFLRKLDSLKYTSLAGLGAVVYMVALAVVNYFYSANEIPEGFEPVPVAPFSVSALKSFAVFIFAFTAHQNICTIQGEAEDPTNAFLEPIIKFSVAASSAAYFIFSILSYAVYGQTTQSNVFLNFPADSLMMTFGRILYVLLSAFSYPLLTHPCRASIINLLPVSPQFKHSNDATIVNSITFLIVVGSVGFSMILTDLGIVSALLGTFIGIPICYLVPGLYYYKLTEADEEGLTTERKMALGLVLFGGVAMLVSSISLYVSLTTPQYTSNILDSFYIAM